MGGQWEKIYFLFFRSGWGAGRKSSCKKKLGGERAEKGQTKNVNLGCHRDRKENPISAPSIHVGALVGAVSLWPGFLGKKVVF
jgi:hypothetical protein